ncbi:MAG: thrombospondin type 3 repeat-containing protein [bacterium]|nr:thrombospondin type 3 repeat-containing protein [bacterium]
MIGALLIAGALIISSYFTAVGVGKTSVVEASTESALLQKIATKDSDGDGLPDWEESLYGTDQHMVDTRGFGMTDGEAVAKGLIVPKAVADLPEPRTTSSSDLSEYGLTAPAEGSLTAAFAKNFFTLYLSTKEAKNGSPLTEADTSAIAEKAMASLSTSIAEAALFKSAQDLAVSGSGEEALRTFAISVEAVLLARKSEASKSELLYLQDALSTGGEGALAPLRSIATNYREVALGLTVLPVPEEAKAAYLEFINALYRIGQISDDFARVESDPLATMLALTQYPQAVLTLGNALIEINTIYRNANITFEKGTSGASFVNIIPDIAVEQNAVTQQP